MTPPHTHTPAGGPRKPLFYSILSFSWRAARLPFEGAFWDKAGESRQNRGRVQWQRTSRTAERRKKEENDAFVATRTRTNVHVTTERASELPRLLMNNGAFFHTRRAIREEGGGGGEVPLLESSNTPPPPHTHHLLLSFLPLFFTVAHKTSLWEPKQLH